MICCFAESDFPELSWRIESSAYTSASKGTTPVEGGTLQVKKKELHAVEGGTPQVEEKSTTQWRGSGGSAPWVFHIWSFDCNNTVGTESRTLNTGTRLRVLLRFTLRLFCCHPHDATCLPLSLPTASRSMPLLPPLSRASSVTITVVCLGLRLKESRCAAREGFRAPHTRHVHHWNPFGPPA